MRYYLVAILFILFDLEIAFLFPWAVALRDIGATGFWAMMIFLGILVVGLPTNGKRVLWTGSEAALLLMSASAALPGKAAANGAALAASAIWDPCHGH